MVFDEISGKYRDFPLNQTWISESSSPHVSIPDNKAISVSTTRLYLKIFRFLPVYGQQLALVWSLTSIVFIMMILSFTSEGLEKHEN